MIVYSVLKEGILYAFYDSGFLTNELIDKWSAKAEELYKDAFKGKDIPALPCCLRYLLGYLLPATNGFCLQEELLMSAYKSDMVDEKIMKAPIE